MAKLFISLLLVLSFTMLYGCGEGKKETKPAEIEGTMLASAFGRIIALEDFNERINNYNSEIQASQDIPASIKSNYLIKTFEDKKKLLEGMVEREILIAEAIKRGLDKDAELQEAVELLKEQFLFAKVIESEKAKAIVTTKEIENYYNQYKEALIIPEERRVSMIVVPAEEKAEEIASALLQGEDFAALAKAQSTDKSASNAGDIGFIVQTSPYLQADKRAMFTKFEEVAFSLEPNLTSDIFKGPDGFYIIKVTEIKQSRQRLLSEVYNDIQQGLLMKKQEEILKAFVANLRKTGNITVHDELLRD